MGLGKSASILFLGLLAFYSPEAPAELSSLFKLTGSVAIDGGAGQISGQLNSAVQFSGSYQSYVSGFSAVNVASASGTGTLPPANTKVYGIQTGFSLILPPVVTGQRDITAAVDVTTACPTSTTNYLYTYDSFGSYPDVANQTGYPYWGLITYTPSSNTLTVNTVLSLADLFLSVQSPYSLPTSCDSSTGLLSINNTGVGDRNVTAYAGANALVALSQSGKRYLGFQYATSNLTAASLSNVYSGFFYAQAVSGSYTSSSPTSLKYIPMMFTFDANGNGTGYALTNPEDPKAQDTSTAYVINLTQFNVNNAPGIAAGTMTVGGQSGNIVCGTTNVSGQESMSCVGQSPSNTAIPFNLILTQSGMARLTITEQSPYDFGNVSSAQSHTFTVTNTGTGSASSIQAPTVAAPFSVTGGTCGSSVTTLALNATCTITVSYAPTADGTHTALLSMNYNDGFLTQTFSEALLGSYGLSSLALSSSTTSISGTTPVSFKSMAHYADTSQQDISSVATWSTTGGAATVDASGNVTAIANGSGTVTASFHGQTATSSITTSVSGTSTTQFTVGGTTEANGSTYVVGTTNVNQPVDTTFTINNTGTAPLVLGAITVPSGFSVTSSPTSPVLPGASTSLTVRLSATTPGTYSGTLSIATNDPSSSYSLSLSGSVAALYNTAASLGISDTSSSFAFPATAYGSTSSHTVVLSTTGGGAASAIAFSGLSGAYSITSNNCSTSLAALQSCTFVVTYTPSNGVSTAGNVLTISYTDSSGSYTVTDTFSGSVYLPSASRSTVAASPTTVVANGTATSTLTATLVDSNGNPFVGRAITLSAGSGSSVITTVSGTTNSSGQATFTVKDSTAETVVYTASDPTDGVTITQTASVTFATPANLQYSDSSPYNFGSVNENSTSTHVFSLTNNGGVAATGFSPAPSATGSYSAISTSCSSTVAAGGSCTVSVQFAPTTTGTLTGTLTVTYNNGSISNATATESLTGTGASTCSGATVSFSYTGSAQTVTAPTGCTHASITLNGAGGGGGVSNGNNSAGGQGGHVSGTISVTPGASYTVIVGGGGVSCPTNQSAAGGGGGHTSIFLSSNLGSPLASAGGGGGGASSTTPYAGGAGCGGNGSGSSPGAGGSTSKGGAGGSGGTGGTSASSNGSTATGEGGGGGAGGGAGGGSDGGGGGGMGGGGGGGGDTAVTYSPGGGGGSGLASGGGGYSGTSSAPGGSNWGGGPGYDKGGYGGGGGGSMFGGGGGGGGFGGGGGGGGFAYSSTGANNGSGGGGGACVVPSGGSSSASGGAAGWNGTNGGNGSASITWAP